MSKNLTRYKYGVLISAVMFAYSVSYLIGEEGDEGIVAQMVASDKHVGEVAHAAPPAPQTRVRTTPRSDEIIPDDFYDDPEPFLSEDQPDAAPDGLTEEYNEEGSVRRAPIVPRIPEGLGPPPEGLVAPPQGEIVMVGG